LYLIYFVKTKGGVLFSPTAIRNNFNPLFIANNAAGGFYSILFSLLFAFYTNNKKKQYVFFMLCCILFLWGTASRGSMLGVICGFGCYVLYKKGRSKLIYLMIGAIIIIQAIIIYNTYPYYKTYLLNNMKNQLTIDFSIESTKEANVYLRAVEMWPRAVFVFANSPIFGSGFGAVNDKPFDFSGISGFISIHNHGNKIFDSSHAHHSFLHILAEEGIVGLSLFLLFWINLYKYIISKKRHYSNIIRVFLIIAFFNLTFMSFTEHRITTPSNALPFILILVLALIYDNSQTKHISK
jgi:O-antigen ligase